MQKLFSDDDLFLVQQVRSELDAANIPYLVKNEYAGGAVGELPWQETQMELWLLDEQWLPKATQIVEALSPADFSGTWQCTACGETNDGQFSLCWKCQTVHDELALGDS